MFDSSKLQDALERSRGGGSYRRDRLVLGAPVPDFLLAEEDDRRPLKIAIVLAVLLHVVVFAVRLPELDAEVRPVSQRQTAFVVQQVRFEPPPPKAAVREQPKPKEERRIIPVPDPTPDELEPIRVEEQEVELDVDDVVDPDAIYGIPEGVEGPGDVGTPLAVPLSGDMTPPRKLHAPQPLYTEEARQKRIQGVVILQTIIDAEGRVTRVEVLKGLPEGLSESAVEAVKQWRFEPAKVEGEPVPVYFNFTISFGLQ